MLCKSCYVKIQINKRKGQENIANTCYRLDKEENMGSHLVKTCQCLFMKPNTRL